MDETDEINKTMKVTVERNYGDFLEVMMTLLQFVIYIGKVYVS